MYISTALPLLSLFASSFAWEITAYRDKDCGKHNNNIDMYDYYTYKGNGGYTILVGSNPPVDCKLFKRGGRDLYKCDHEGFNTTHSYFVDSGYFELERADGARVSVNDQGGCQQVEFSAIHT